MSALQVPGEIIRVDLSRQRLELTDAMGERYLYSLSSAAKGAGEQNGSECTPRGKHIVRLKIGDGCPLNTVFVGRRATGEIYDEVLAAKFPGRDWILTRILWLTGAESTLNRGGSVDSLRRFIYIHGCPQSEPMGQPKSHGCIRMHNADVVDLFDRTSVGTPVLIQEFFDHWDD